MGDPIRYICSRWITRSDVVYCGDYYDLGISLHLEEGLSCCLNMFIYVSYCEVLKHFLFLIVNSKHDQGDSLSK